MFVDADMIFSPSLIEACVETAHKGEFVALHIPEIVLGKNFFSRVRRFERSFYNGTVIDGARFFKKQAFVGVGGFDETLSGPEDWDIDKKIKKTGQIGLVSEPLGAGKQTKPWVLSDFILKRGVSPDCYGSVIYHNEAEFNLVKYLSKKGYYSHSMGTYASKWGASDPDIKKQLGLFYRFIGVFVENGKWKRLISHPILMLGMYFLRFLVGSTFLLNKGTQ